MTTALSPDCQSPTPIIAASSLDPRVEDVVAGLPYMDNQGWQEKVLEGSKFWQSSSVKLKVPECGLVSVTTAWNKPCDTVRGVLAGRGYFDKIQAWEPEVGEAPNSGHVFLVPTLRDGEEDGCTVREPARMQDCPSGSVCGADGRCSGIACSAESCEELKPEVDFIEAQP